MRTVAAFALAAYSVVLLLSAWPETAPETRLGQAALVARSLLAPVGIRGGLSVFRPPRERIERVVRNDCVRVRAVDADGRRRLVHPEDGGCFERGARLRVPAIERLLRSVLVRAPTPLGLMAVGDWLCHPTEGPEPATVELLWSQP